MRGVFGSYRNYTEVRGIIADNRYTSPHGNFSCEVPPLLKPGAIVHDSYSPIDGNPAGEVVFYDDTGVRSLVEWMALPDSVKQMSPKDIWNTCVTAMTKTAKKYNQEATVESEKVIGTGENQSYFYMVRIPKGSLSRINHRRIDAAIAALIFCKGNYLYCVARAEPIFDLSETTEQRETDLKLKLDKFLEKFEFK